MLKKQIETKLLPQAVDVETAVLGSAIMFGDYKLAIELLKPETFYKESHQLIFKAIQSLVAEGVKPDTLSVYQKLKSNGEAELVGGAYYISQLTTGIVSYSNFEYYCRILIEKWLKREFIRLCQTMTNNLFEDSTDVLELINKFKKDIEAATNFETANSITTLSEAMQEVYQHVCKLSIDPNYRKQFLTGIEYYDKIYHGLQPGWLIIISGISSHGKTSLATQIAIEVCKRNSEAKGLYYTLEMPKKEVVERILAMETGICASDIENVPMQNDQINSLQIAIGKLNNLQFLFDKNISNNSELLIHNLKKNIEKYKLNFIVIDYLQLINLGTATNHELQLSSIVNSFKAVAKDYNVTLIVISQFSKGDGTDLQKLKGSSSIEQAADQVIIVKRPNKDNEDEDITQSIADIKIPKTRNGATCKFKLFFNPKITKFTTYTGENYTANWEDIKPF